MADISTIKIGNDVYNIADQVARQQLAATINTSQNRIPIQTDNFEELEYPVDEGLSIIILPNIFCKIGGVTNSLKLTLDGEAEGYVSEYMGKFHIDELTNYTVDEETITPDSFTFEIDGAVLPDNTPSFEVGHTYEFSIIDGVAVVADITYTEEENEGE